MHTTCLHYCINNWTQTGIAVKGHWLYKQKGMHTLLYLWNVMHQALHKSYTGKYENLLLNQNQTD